jgi:hypothetical protein
MFHVEIRMGMHYVREFNLDERVLWVRFLAPLMEGRTFTLEGHDYEPRTTKIVILDGPKLRADQLSMGRGWQNAKRASQDVTDVALARAHELREGMERELAARSIENVAAAVAAIATPALADVPLALPAPSPSALRERLIGRLGAGPVSAEQIAAIAESLMPASDEAVRRAACEQVVWELLAGGEAQLAPSER